MLIKDEVELEMFLVPLLLHYSEMMYHLSNPCCLLINYVYFSFAKKEKNYGYFM